MNDQNSTNKIAPEALPVVPLGVPDTPQPEQSSNLPAWKNTIEKIKPILGKIFDKLYSNKLVFWSICIFVGIVLFIVIVGSLFFKGKSRPISNPTPTAVPFIRETPIASNSGDIISISQEKLFQLKNQLEELDVNQKRLQPPTLNFDIKF